MKRNKRAKITKKDLKRAFIKTIPVLTGYLVLGIGYGIIMQVKGFGILWALGLSLFLFAGSMQFVAIGLLTGGASLLTTALTTLAVNARHLFYGISMVDRYKTARRKPFLIFGLTDETYALVSNPLDTEGMEEGERDNYYFLVTLFDWIYWAGGTAIGCLAGSFLHFNTAGIDFALTALFVSIFVEQWIETKNHTAAITGVLASVLALLVFGADNFLIPAMILIAAALTIMRRKLDVPGGKSNGGDFSE